MTRHDQPLPETLIGDLVADAGPVRRLGPPLLRTGLWLLMALAVIAVAAGFHGPSQTLASLAANPAYLLQFAGGLVTALLAALAAFKVSLPGQSPRWALLPLPGLALWLVFTGYGCLTDWLHPGPTGLVWGQSAECFRWIVLVSLPIGGAFFLMVRHATQVRPVMTLTLAMLATSALVATALMLIHPYEATILVLLGHGGAVLLAVLIGYLSGHLAGRGFLSRP